MNKFLILSALSLQSVSIVGAELHVASNSSSGWPQDAPQACSALQELKGALVNEERFEAFCKRWTADTYPYDVDQLYHRPQRLSGGDSISKALISHLKRALKIAELVQKRRSNRRKIFDDVLQVCYKKGRGAFDDLMPWFERNHDKNLWLALDSLLDRAYRGEMIDDNECGLEVKLVTTRLLEIAYLLQPYRSYTAKTHIFEKLLTLYEGNGRFFDDLQEWFANDPFDFDKVFLLFARQQLNTMFQSQIIKALPVAHLIQPYRTNKASVAGILYALKDWHAFATWVNDCPGLNAN
jgi:hypothetical protein